MHEPFAPSAASAALRHSNALNVGSFHAAAERFLSTQVARRLVELLFGRLDGRTASFKTTRDLVQRYFPGDYRVISPGRRPRAARAGSSARELIEIVYVVEEERAALRMFLRALRRLPADLPWQATIWARSPAALPSMPLSRAIRDRVRFAGPDDGSEGQHLARAQIVVAASNGAAPATGTLLRGMAGGAVPVAARLPQYEEALEEGELGLLFEPRDTETLTDQLDAPHRRRRSARAAAQARVRGARAARPGRASPTSSRSCTRRSPTAATTRPASPTCASDWPTAR